MKRLLIAILIAATLAGCDKTRYYYSTSYVVEYRKINSLSLRIYDSKDYIQIDAGETQFIGNILSTGEQKAAFDALCIKHYDTGYNKTIKTLIGNPHFDDGTQCAADDYLSINVVSDSDWNETHRAGNSLNDITMMDSYTVFPYIISGYKDPENPIPGSINYTDIEKLLTELTSEEMILMGGDWVVGRIYFVEKPTLSKSHRITVEVKTDDGRTMAPTIDIFFDNNGNIHQAED